MILIGSRFGDPWAELFEKRMNFIFNPENPNQIVNRVPKDGESRTYEFGTPGSDGYCIIAYLPIPTTTAVRSLSRGRVESPPREEATSCSRKKRCLAFRKRSTHRDFPILNFY